MIENDKQLDFSKKKLDEIEVELAKALTRKPKDEGLYISGLENTRTAIAEEIKQYEATTGMPASDEGE